MINFSENNIVLAVILPCTKIYSCGENYVQNVLLSVDRTDGQTLEKKRKKKTENRGTKMNKNRQNE